MEECYLTPLSVQVLTAVIYCLFSAGIVFGYAALKPVLIDEGVYRDRCTQEELDDNVKICYGQEIRYGNVAEMLATSLTSPD